MDFQKVINSRRSIRSFEEKQVPKNILKELIIDAAKAPSSSNLQPWQFYAVCSKKARNKISEALRSFLKMQSKSIKKLPEKLQKAVYDFYNNLGGCQNLIFVYIDKEKERHKRDSMIMSVSAAAENLMLSAVNKGLGTCWVGSFKHIEKDVNKILGVKDKELTACLVVGYPKKGYKPLVREKKKLNEILKFI